MLKVLKKILIAILIIIILLTIGFSIFMGREVFKGFTNIMPAEETIKNAKTYQKYFDAFAKDKVVEQLNIPSSKYDHQIPALFIKKPGNKNIAVLVHGLGGTKTSIPHIMSIFLDLGYDVIAIDQRNSGDNKAPYNTFGVLESFDVLDAVKTAKTKIDDDGKIALWGESYGGATAAIAAGRDDSDIDYLILESPVSDSNELLDPELKKIEKSQGIPFSYMKWTGNFYTKFKLHFTFSDINACAWIKDVSVPVLITNSDTDKVTKPHMAEDLYNAVSHNRKKLFTAKGFEHTEFPKKEEEEYKNLINEFLEKYK